MTNQLPPSAVFQAVIDDLVERAPQWMAAVLDQCLKNVERLKPGASKDVSASQARLVAELIRTRRDVFAQAFARSLREQLQGPPSDFLTLDAAPVGNSDVLHLRLLDEPDAEEDVELLRNIEFMDSEVEWDLRDFHARAATLKGPAVATEHSHPLRPQTLLRAWAQTLKNLQLTQATRLALMRVISAPLSLELKRLVHESTSRLEAMGVAPTALRHVPTMPTRPGVELESGFDATRPGALHELLQATRQSKPGLAVAQRASPGGFARLEELLAVDETLDRLVCRLHQSKPSQLDDGQLDPPSSAWAALTGGRRVDPAAQGVGHSVNVIRQNETRLLALAQRDSERRIIAVMANLFDQVLLDRFVPSSVKSLLCCLQGSTLRVALKDQALFDAHDHPTWSLFNQLAGYTMGYTDERDPRLIASVQAMRQVIGAVTLSPAPDAALHAQALEQWHRYVTDAIVEEQRAAGHVIERLQTRDRVAAMRQMFQMQLASLLEGIDVPESLQSFLTQDWVQVMVASALPDYQGKVPTASYAQTYEELVESFKPVSSAAQRQQLLARVPSMVARVREGMALIAVSAQRQDAVLQALMSLHQQWLKAVPVPPKSAKEAADLSAKAIVQRMREESLAQVDASAQAGAADSLIDLHSLDTVPAGIELKEVSMSTWAKRVSIGTWVHAFQRGAWASLRLIWRSDSGAILLFATPEVDHPLSMTQAAFECLVKERLAGPLETHNLFERAVDAMMVAEQAV